MADFQLKVTAETQGAEKDLKRLGVSADSATKERKLRIDVKEINKSFKDVQSNIKEAENTIKTFYRISKNIPGIGERVKEFESLAKGAANVAKNAPASAAALRENAKAGSILSNSFEAASTSASALINNLAKAGFALFAVKQAVGLVQGAFSGFFDETIGREIKLRETILKTQTTLASTNKVFRNGKEITDPYEKIVALTGEVAKRIDSIRERSIALAGVTSNDVIEVFGIVAGQIGQIGGGLKEAEDLAINFAAALGTFGIPLYQARQEIGSILRGDITMDSYLAKSLGITNEDIAKAKSQVGGVVKFLEERLAAAVAGQKIAAQGFAGVVSNIKDLAELVNQKFGAGLLDPLLGGLSRIFDFLFKIREEIFAIASGMGRGLGQLLSTNLTAIGGGSALFGQIGAGAESFAASLGESVKTAFASLQRDANTLIAPLRNLFEEITKSISSVGAGLVRLAQGFISIKIENFKALVQIFSNLSEAVTAFSAVLGQVLRAYGQLLQVPLVQYLSQISAQFQLLEKLGVMAAVKLAIAAGGLIAAWTPIVTFFQALVARIAALLGGLVIAVGAVFTRVGAVISAFAATLTATYPAAEAFKQQMIGLSTSLTAAGAAADKAGISVTTLGGASAAAARMAGTAILNFIKFNAILLAIQVGITVVVDLFGRFQRAQEEAARSQRASEALRELQTKYKDVGDATDSATKAARDYRQALVDANYAQNLDALEKVREKINQIRYELKPGIQSWREFWSALSGAEVGRFEEGSRQALKGLTAEQQRLQAQLNAVDRARDKQRLAENISLEAQNRVNLEKEIKDIQRQQANDLFQQRQALAQKEVETFRAAGERRIFQMEQANKKLIEGEEGASRTALEALNNYLSVRERGELDIEAAKKTLAIEVTNLEKTISDYRLENEKKIAEIRKRAGDYEKKVADYQRQSAGQSTPVSSATGLLQGNTGTSSSGPHFHVAGASSEAEARAIFAADVNKNLQLTDVPGSPRSGGRRHAGYDLAGPAGTPLNLAAGYTLTNFTRDPKGLGGNYATIAGPNNKSYKVMHLQDPGANYKGPGSSPINPKAPAFDDVSAPAVEKYAAAVRGVTSAMERLRVIQQQLTEAKTAEAFEAISKAIFEPVKFEQYQDELKSLSLTYDALALTAGKTYDPERAKLQIDARVKEASANRELGQVQDEINRRQNLSEAERTRLLAQLKERHAAYVESLRQEATVQSTLLTLRRGAEAVQQLRTDTRQIYEELEATKLRNRLEAENVSPARINAEVEKLRLRRQLNDLQAQLLASLDAEKQKLDELNKKRAQAKGSQVAELQKQLADAQDRIRELQAQLKGLPAEGKNKADAIDARAALEDKDPLTTLFDRWKRELKDTKAMVASLAQTVQSELSTAMSSAITGVINGTTTIGEAFGSMFQKIGEAFIKMATEMIAKMIVMFIFNQLLGGLLGGGGGGSASASSFSMPSAGFLPEGGFKLPGFKALGGPVLANTPYIVGERGPELFVPRMSGGVMTNNDLRSYLADSRAALGGGSRGQDSAFADNRDALSATSTVSRERYVESVLTSGASSTEIKYSRVGSGDLPFVTEEDMLQATRVAAEEGAKRGQQRTLAALRNNPATRRSIGV